MSTEPLRPLDQKKPPLNEEDVLASPEMELPDLDIEPAPEKPAPAAPERFVAQERAAPQEQRIQKEVSFEDEPSLLQKLHLQKTKKAPPIPAPVQQKDDLTKKVEAVLSEGLEDIYSSLPPVKKVEFRMRGEETASAIRQLLQKTHINLKKIFKLLVSWLKILPGVSIFFLEKEAKIKTEQIIALDRENKMGR